MAQLLPALRRCPEKGWPARLARSACGAGIGTKLNRRPRASPRTADTTGPTERSAAVIRTLAIIGLLLAAPIAAQPAHSSLQPTPAVQIFERDWVLMNWALKYYDADRDILLEPNEAQAAAEEFRRIADANQDGRVTTLEYRQARAFILARY